jgi:hypothetical protein
MKLAEDGMGGAGLAPCREAPCRLDGLAGPLGRSYVIFLLRRVSALVAALWIEDLSGYRHAKTAI